jgi:hypothetical protein
VIGDELYAWQVLEDGAWGLILAEVVPGMGPTVCVSRSLAGAHLMGLFAVHHHDATGLPVRCIRLALAEVVREVP